MSRQLPLRVVGDIGAGGALARIEKGRKVLGDKKSDWNHTDELPVSSGFLISMTYVHHFGRLRYPFHQKIGITRYLHA